MGDPKKLHQKFQTPNHPWQKARIEEEKKLIKEYGLKNKRDIWKMNTILKKYHSIAKKIIASRTKQSEKEKDLVLAKLHSLNLVSAGADVQDILEITIKDILERRLQTILVKKSFARSMTQARQFITHNHILVNGKKVTNPSYMVTESELKNITFNPKSSLFSEEHPERALKNEKQKEGRTEDKKGD